MLLDVGNFFLWRGRTVKHKDLIGLLDLYEVNWLDVDIGTAAATATKGRFTAVPDQHGDQEHCADDNKQ